MKRNIQTLANLIERGRIDINTLTRKERKALEQSQAVSNDARKAQSAQQISSNEYMEIELPEPKKVVKAEKIGFDWSFSEIGYRGFVPMIENMLSGKCEDISGYRIYKATMNEAVLYQL